MTMITQLVSEFTAAWEKHSNVPANGRGTEFFGMGNYVCSIFSPTAPAGAASVDVLV